MHEAFMETWLVRYADAPYNLGESGVRDLTIRELLDASGGEAALGAIELNHNDVRGSQELREAIAALYDEVSPEQVLLTAGTTEAILLYFLAQARTGANVVVADPTFHLLYDMPAKAGFEVRRVPLDAQRGFALDLDALARAVDGRTQVIVLNTPNNPTGAVHSLAELGAVVELARRHDAQVLLDEHYRLMPLEADALVPSMAGRDARVVALGSAGKCLGSVGLRVGWLIADAAVLEACIAQKDFTTHTVCKLNDQLALQQLRARDMLTQRFRGWIHANIRAFEQLVESKPGVLDWSPPQAGTMAFPRWVDPRIDGLELARALVEREGVQLLPGEAFDLPGWFRLRLGVPPEHFAEAMRRMEGFLSAYLPQLSSSTPRGSSAK